MKVTSFSVFTVIILSVVLLSGRERSAEATLINFDDAPSGTQIDTRYTPLGVTFGCFNGTTSNICTGHAFAIQTAFAASPPNVISLDTTTLSGFLVDERTGFFRATFTSPVGLVSIAAMPVLLPEGETVTVNRPFLQAFNSGGQLLSEADYSYATCNPNTTQCPYQTLAINRAANDISFVAFSSFHTSGGTALGVFDNLNFSPVASQIPEPPAVLLLILGLAGLGASIRRQFPK